MSAVARWGIVAGYWVLAFGGAALVDWLHALP
jgi:hypothetical protein